jgi:hypothetical protein
MPTLFNNKSHTNPGINWIIRINLKYSSMKMTPKYGDWLGNFKSGKLEIINN